MNLAELENFAGSNLDVISWAMPKAGNWLSAICARSIRARASSHIDSPLAQVQPEPFMGRTRMRLGVACLTFSLAAASAQAVDRLVPQQYASIQAAVDAASDEDRVVIAPRVYREGVLINSKRLTLVSSGAERVVIWSYSTPMTIGYDAQVHLKRIELYGTGSENSVFSGTTGGIALYCLSAQATFEDCVLRGGRGNGGKPGGTAAVISGEAIVDFQDCDLGGGVGNPPGDGISCQGPATLRLIETWVEGGDAGDYSAGRGGNAIVASRNASIQLLDCVIQGGLGGGGVAGASGQGGIGGDGWGAYSNAIVCSEGTSLRQGYRGILQSLGRDGQAYRYLSGGRTCVGIDEIVAMLMGNLPPNLSADINSDGLVDSADLTIAVGAGSQ